VSLSRARLSICEDCARVALHNLIKRGAHGVEYKVLRRRAVQHLPQRSVIPSQSTRACERTWSKPNRFTRIVPRVSRTSTVRLSMSI
jgi:hypothetical protein